MSKYIPDDISKAEKQGFSAPDASWFKGESIDYVIKKFMFKGFWLFLRSLSCIGSSGRLVGIISPSFVEILLGDTNHLQKGPLTSI